VIVNVSKAAVSLAFLTALATPNGWSQQWTAPTPEELSMTSIPEVPGAPAVYLFKEELADDAVHSQNFYFRIKILTEGGKDYANVELPFTSGESGLKVESITGRTIHADGTIIPFTGKPYEKTVETMQDYKVKVKVFSLPAAEVGSILEYRYAMRSDDHIFYHPDWKIQTELFTRKAHYMWRPTDQQLSVEDGKQVSSTVAWTPLLPKGAEIKQTKLMATRGRDGGSVQLDLDVHDIPPIPKEQFMPPMQSLSYKVLFYYTAYRSSQEFWNAEGKRWAKMQNKFAGPGPAASDAVKTLTAGATTQDQKLRKIYAAVMQIENTDFTRARSTAEERADGLKDIKSADDVWTRKRGNGDQITALFIGMARAAGMKAYAMGIANRGERFFLPAYLSMGQLDDDIAIVNVDGKEVYFDPGQRYCPYGRLSWVHSYSGGLRETDAGVELGNTPALVYTDDHVSRIADLKIDDEGVASGTIRMSYTGDSALAWRHRALRSDDTALRQELRVALEHMMPGGMEIKVKEIENLTDPEKELKVAYEVKGPIGSATGKRLLLAANLFEANSKPKFPEATRDLAIDMRYPNITQDAVRFTLPASLAIESAPTATATEMKGAALFNTKVTMAGTSITLYRNITVGRTMFPADSYNDLRNFFGKVEAKDQETLVLTREGTAKSASGGN
jgi:hypothetical protein